METRSFPKQLPCLLTCLLILRAIFILSIHPFIQLLHAVHSETTVAKIQYVNVVRHGCDVTFTKN